MAVYFVRNTRTGSIKIGRSKHPWCRLAELQTAHEHELEIICEIAPWGYEQEATLHRHFARERIRGEWFFGEETGAFAQAIGRIANAMSPEEGQEKINDIANALLACLLSGSLYFVQREVPTVNPAGQRNGKTTIIEACVPRG